MAQPDAVVKLPRQLPAEIAPALNLTPNEMRGLREETGRTLTDLLGGDPNDLELAPDRIQTLVWAALRRKGYDVSWEQAGDVAAVADEPDPTTTGK